MKLKLHMVLVLLSLVIVVAFTNYATAQELSVSTDKTLYLPGEVVVITGTAVANQLVGISIYNPSGIEVDFRMVRSGNDGRYRAEVVLPSKLGEPPYENWVPGVYTIRAWIGSVFATTTFELIPGAKITGVIVDANNNPLANAVITVKELGILVRSGVDGTFTLYVKPGTYTLIVSKEGYRSVEIKIDIVQYENNIGVIKLEPSTTPTITTPVTVTVTVTQTITSPLTITETQTQTEIQTTTITQVTTETATKTIVETMVSPTTTTIVKTFENTITATKTEVVTTTQTQVSTLMLERTITAYVTTTTTLTSIQPNIGLTIGVGVALLALGLAIGWLVLGKGIKFITERSK